MDAEDADTTDDSADMDAEDADTTDDSADMDAEDADATDDSADMGAEDADTMDAMDDVASNCTVSVIYNDTRLRAGPSLIDSVLTYLAAGTVLNQVAMSADGMWFEVEHAEGQNAYIHSSVVTSSC